MRQDAGAEFISASHRLGTDEGGIFMIFGRKALRLAAALVGTALLGSALTGCGGNEAKSDEIRIGANFEMTGNINSAAPS